MVDETPSVIGLKSLFSEAASRPRLTNRNQRRKFIASSFEPMVLSLWNWPSGKISCAIRMYPHMQAPKTLVWKGPTSDLSLGAHFVH